MTRAQPLAFALWAAFTFPGAALASGGDDLLPLSAMQVKQRWHSRLDGRHFTARIGLEMNLGGLRESRELQVWRDDRDGSGERVMVRFESPPDLRNVGLLYLAHADRPNDYFLYQPATRRVRRLPETVADDDVYGIDLEFLGFGVAQTEPTEIEGMTSVVLRGRRTYRLAERARRVNPRFQRRITWLDAKTFVPLKTEHVLDGVTTLRAETVEVRTIHDVPTPVRMSFKRADVEREVELVVHDVDYEAPIPAEYFSVMALVRAKTGQ